MVTCSNFQINYTNENVYCISFYSISNFLQSRHHTITLNILDIWEFINVEYAINCCHGYIAERNPAIVFNRPSHAQKFIDQYLIPQMVASNLISNDRKFKVG